MKKPRYLWLFAASMLFVFFAGFPSGAFAAQQTFTFPQIVEFLPGGGDWSAYCSDSATATQFCKMKGFDNYTTYQTRYIGPRLDNDYVLKWNGSSFVQVGGLACPNVIDPSITCADSASVILPACFSNSGCGTDGYIGDNFCNGNNVYRKYKTYICSNPGAQNASCLNSIEDRLVTACSAGQTCSNGTCQNNNNAVPVIDFRINGSTGTVSIAYNTGVTLTWNVTGATSCTASGDWSGSKATSGSEFVGYLTSSKTYILTCTGPGGTTVSSATASVSGQQNVLPTVDLKINGYDGTVYLGNNSTATLSWNSSNANSCQASGNWSGSRGTSGSESTGYISYSATYTLTCSNNYGSTTDSVNVTINNQQQYPCYYGSQCQPCYSSQCQQSCNYYGSLCQGYQYQIPQYNYNYNTNPVIYPSYSNVTVLKQGRNLSSGTGAFSDVIVANPGDIVMFQAAVTNPTSNYLQSVIVRDTLAQRTVFAGGLLVDGSPIVGGDGGLFSSGVNIGNLAPGQTKYVSFQVRVADASQFPSGQTRLIDTSTASASNGGSASDSAAICITRNLVSGVSYGSIASYVSTGITDNPFVDLVVIPLALTLFILFVFKSKILKLGKRLDRRKEADSELEIKIAEIRKKEFGLEA